MKTMAVNWQVYHRAQLLALLTLSTQFPTRLRPKIHDSRGRKHAVARVAVLALPSPPHLLVWSFPLLPVAGSEQTDGCFRRSVHSTPEWLSSYDFPDPMGA